MFFVYTIKSPPPYNPPPKTIILTEIDIYKL